MGEVFQVGVTPQIVLNVTVHTLNGGAIYYDKYVVASQAACDGEILESSKNVIGT